MPLRPRYQIRTKIKHVKLNSFLKATTAMMSISLSRSSSMLMANGAPEEVEINRVMFSFPLWESSDFTSHFHQIK